MYFEIVYDLFLHIFPSWYIIWNVDKIEVVILIAHSCNESGLECHGSWVILCIRKVKMQQPIQ